MSDGFESLGKARLDLEANLIEFERNISRGRRSAEGMGDTLDHLAAIAELAQHALNQVKLSPGHGAESKISAEGIISGVRGVSEEAFAAAHELDRVRLTDRQAAESEVPAGLIERMLDRITRKSNETRRSLESVKLAGGVPGRSGVGVGPFGSGFGRVGALGLGIGAGVLTAPAAAPAAAGLLAAIPTFAFAGAGALGTLALAFHGVGKAIKGDQKAFGDLTPAAQKFVLTVRSLDGFFDRLRQTAAAGLFPGLTSGLRAALSPGTVTVLTRSIGEIARALGGAFAQLGRFFGSTEFQSLLGPLMQSAARTVSVLSDAFLHLFDALGVVARAAIPLVDWLNKAIDRGARLADQWLHAKDASGALARGMNEARQSLSLVGGLVTGLLRVLGALGRALYPLAKVAIKALTGGLNALARIINRNRETIREIVGGALSALIVVVKTASKVIGALFPIVQKVAHAMGGWRNVILGLIALKLAGTIAGWGGSFGKLVGRMGLARDEAGKLSLSFLGKAGLVAGVLAASFAITTLILHLTGLDKKLRSAGGALYDFLHPKQSDERHATKRELHSLVPRLVKEIRELRAKGMSTAEIEKRLRAEMGSSPMGDEIVAAAFHAVGASGAGSSDHHTRPPRHKPKPKPGTHEWYMQNLGYDPNDIGPTNTSDTSVFGKTPPFTTNVPKPPLIPALASRDLALASSQASQASVLGNVGALAKRHLELELTDLDNAAKLIRDKYEHAVGQTRTQLFAALTRVQNRIRTVREQIVKAIKTNHAQQLRFAVERAQEAVAAATVGSKAYERAIAAEEKALRAEIAYLDKRAKNTHLALAAREKEIKQETADRHKLAALLKPHAPGAASTAANEAQFLSSFQAIVGAFAPNAQPQGGSGQTDTHLYDIKHELRQQTPLLRTALKRTAFPASAYGLVADAAVGVT